MRAWGNAIHRASRTKQLLLAVKLLPRFVAESDFRYKVTSLRYGCNRLRFEREIMSHQRMVFEKCV